MTPLYDTTLRLLRRVDDDVILSVATRHIIPFSPNECLCGWVLREKIARITGADPQHIIPDRPTVEQCAARFGGSAQDWSDLYWRITSREDFPDIEAAFTDRVAEAVGG